MNIRTSIKTTIYLLIASLAAYILAEITNRELFTWLAMALIVWLFLRLYWFGIELIAYQTKLKSKEHDTAQVEEVVALVESKFAPPYEQVLPTSQSLQQTTSE